MQIKRAEQGSSLAWTAVFLVTVMMPLMLFVIDGSRLFYIRGRLQTATDAACEDAAWAAGDRLTYINTGQTRFGNDWYVVEVAQATFLSTLHERTRLAFTPQLRVALDYANNQILCSATANVPVFFNVAGVAPQVNIPTTTITGIRFR
jgi:uncharacterized membrane protein